MSEGNLKNKPLVEALLELTWRIPPGPEGDPHYRLLLGRFSEKVAADYPFHEPLPTAQVPDVMVPYMAQHRFRKGAGRWPLVQIGPGIMTVNETDAYTWGSFRECCVKAVKDLFDAHPAKQDFPAQGLTLRYIDAVEVDFSRESVFDFLETKMKTKISLPDSLFEGTDVNRNPEEFNWQASFPHSRHGGAVTLRFAMGKKLGKSALVWETLVQAAPNPSPLSSDTFSSWIDAAHGLTHTWFTKLIEGDLKRKFSGDQ